MFSYTIKSKDFFNGEIKVEVEFLQGITDAQPFTETYRPRSKNELDTLIKNRIAELERMETFVDGLPIGEYTFEPEPAPHVPTQEELEQQEWLANWRLYHGAERGMKALQEAGIEPTEDELTRFNALKQWVADNRKPEYSQYI